MGQIKYQIDKGTIMGQRGFVSLSGGDPSEELAQQVVSDIAIEIKIEAGGVTMPLAMWLDPDYWESDWKEVLDGESFDEYVARCVEA